MNFILTLSIIFYLLSCIRTSNTPEYRLCVKRGIAFYNKHDMFPKGPRIKNPEDAAKAKCFESTKSFGPRNVGP